MTFAEHLFLAGSSRQDGRPGHPGRSSRPGKPSSSSRHHDTRQPNDSPLPDKKPSRRHHCPQCGKGFNRPSSLRTHMNTHTGQMPYLCPWPRCGRTFNVNSNMRRHYRKHVGPDGAPLPTLDSTRVSWEPVRLYPLNAVTLPASPESSEATSLPSTPFATSAFPSTIGYGYSDTGTWSTCSEGSSPEP
ncbi:hypothetical protein DL96DRAFT_1716521 [Flagelloscypha sp. PMI_526]|nr:hypothetical protein DL96DRAFT_1716521 [Flagelloscypha sp. PMI_526]